VCAEPARGMPMVTVFTGSHLFTYLIQSEINPNPSLSFFPRLPSLIHISLHHSNFPSVTISLPHSGHFSSMNQRVLFLHCFSIRSCINSCLRGASIEIDIIIRTVIHRHFPRQCDCHQIASGTVITASVGSFSGFSVIFSTFASLGLFLLPFGLPLAMFN